MLFMSLLQYFGSRDYLFVYVKTNELIKREKATAVTYIYTAVWRVSVTNHVSITFSIHKIITYNTFTQKNTYTVHSKFVLA